MAAQELCEIKAKGWQSQTLGDGTAHQLFYDHCIHMTPIGNIKPTQMLTGYGSQ